MEAPKKRIFGIIYSMMRHPLVGSVIGRKSIPNPMIYTFYHSKTHLMTPTLVSSNDYHALITGYTYARTVIPLHRAAGNYLTMFVSLFVNQPIDHH